MTSRSVPLLRLAPLALLSGSVALAGCTTWPRTEAQREKNLAEVTALLARPLDADDAVQIALLNNHALQASFEELGISEADLVQSGHLPDPRFMVRHASAAALQVIELADRTRTAYFTALASRDSLRYAWQVKNAAETSAELAHRMFGAGNWNRLDQSQQQSFYLQAMQQLARAQLADARDRAELRRLLGIPDERSELRLADQLPELPTNIVVLPDLDASALLSRIDLKMMRADLDELAHRLKLTKATRIVNVLDAGPARVREGGRDSPYEKGYELDLEIPLFDSGDARVRRAEALYAQAAQRFSQAVIDARTEVREAAEQYRIAYELAVREHDDIMPIRKQITKQDVLRYNASLIGVFELLADARAQIASVDDYRRSVRDFWIARSHLDTALLGAPTP